MLEEMTAKVLLVCSAVGLATLLFPLLGETPLSALILKLVYSNDEGSNQASLRRMALGAT
jgi:hypothetical protein